MKYLMVSRAESARKNRNAKLGNLGDSFSEDKIKVREILIKTGYKRTSFTDQLTPNGPYSEVWEKRGTEPRKITVSWSTK